MNNTLLLDVSGWDLVLDAGGNIAMAQPPYALAQDVASAIKLFTGELWYNSLPGVPYFAEILGETPPLAFFQAYMVEAAKTVPGVVSAQCTIQSFTDRTVSGQVLFVDESGNQNSVSF